MTRSSIEQSPSPQPSTRAAISLTKLAAVLGAAPPSSDADVTGVSDDSRTVQPGDLYLALPGSHVHGLDFERQAVARGAVAILSDRVGAVLPTLVVEDPRRNAGPISAHVHGHPSRSLDVYGITGTNGKTSTAYLIAAGLSAAGETVGTITGISISGPGGSTEALRTTPEAAPLQRTLARFRDEGVTAAAVEVSSHASVHRRIDGTRFAVMGFTNLSQDHLDFHGSMENYFASKSVLFTPEYTVVAAIGIDDNYGLRLARSVAVPCWRWSTTDRSAEVFGDKIDASPTGTTLTARTPNGRFDIRLPLLGPHQAANALAALTMLAANGVDLDAAVHGFEQLQGVPGRLERVDVGQPFLAVVDYMHNTAGQHRLLPYLRTLTTGKLIVVIGATGDRDPGKRFPLGATAAALADIVVVSDESPYSEDAGMIRAAVAEGALAVRTATVFVEPDRRTAFDLAVACAEPGDSVVVTGRGCDGRQIFGDDVRTFDDRDELRKALHDRVFGTMR